MSDFACPDISAINECEVRITGNTCACDTIHTNPSRTLQGCWEGRDWFLRVHVNAIGEVFCLMNSGCYPLRATTMRELYLV